MQNNPFVRQKAEKPASDLLLALVSVTYSDGTVTLILDGMSTALQKRYKTLSSAWPLAEGDRVVVMKLAGTYVVLGKIGNAIPMPIATETTLGGIIVGAHLSIDENGVLSGEAGGGGGGEYVLPAATATTLGGIKVGNGLSVTAAGTLSADEYTLPKAAADILGGVKVGNNLSIDADGVLAATLPPATALKLGGIKVGNGLSVQADGTLSATGGGGSYVLPPATIASLGGVIVGAGLSVDSNGVLSASSSGEETTVVTSGIITPSESTTYPVTILAEEFASAGKKAMLHLNYSFSVALNYNSTEALIGTLNPGFRPAVDVIFPTMARRKNNYPNEAYITIRSSGEVYHMGTLSANDAPEFTANFLLP